MGERDFTSIREKLLQLAETLEQHIVRRQSEANLDRRDTGEPADQPIAEPLRARRLEIEKPGRVTLKDWPLEMACRITELRVGGARLKLPCIFTLPDTFDVTVVDSQKTFLAIKIWQRGVDVGVAFMDVRPNAV